MSSSEVQKDVEELKAFLGQAERERVKAILSAEVRKLELEIARLENPPQNSEAMDTTGILEVKKMKVSKCSTVQEKSYAWDQSDKFLKIYASLTGVQKAPKENITCEFTANSFKLRVNEFNNKNHEWHVTRLLETIDPEESYYKVKTDMILLMLKKKQTGKTWAFVTERENKAKEAKKPNLDDNKDPNEGLMDMLKQMYEDGDDEMKRSISKAWSSSRDKQTTM